MILVIALFLLFLLFFILGPVFYGDAHKNNDNATVKDSATDEYAEENLRLYQERVAELAAADLEDEHRQELQLELDREFLASEQFHGYQQQTAPSIKQRLWVPILMLVFVALGTLSLYQFWGASSELDAAELLHASASENFSAADETRLLQVLAQAAQDNPKKLEWGYYYGRVLMNVGQYGKASNVFADLLAGLPVDNEGDRVSILNLLIQARFFDSEQKPSPELYELIEQSLTIEPNQPQFQGLAGMMAFELGKYRDAITHWQTLWQALPDDPNTKILEQGITRAAGRLKEQGESVDLSFLKRTKLTVLVDVSPAVKAALAPETLVFVSAVAVDGPPMPLAAQRLMLGDLPKQVVLSDAQAVVEGMNLSRFKQVTLKATVSLSGQPSAQKGDWQGELSPVSNQHDGVLTLMINKQIQ